MEQFDAEKARRVWSRVQGQKMAVDWSEILSIKVQTAARYGRLARFYRGQTGAVLRKFYRQEQGHIAMISGTQEMAYTLGTPKEPVRAVLQQCYSDKLRLLTLYEKYANTPDWSRFQTMISDDQTQCRYLLRMINGSRSAPR